MSDAREPADTERDNEQNDLPPPRQRSFVSPFVLTCIALFIFMNNQGEELTARNQYLDALAMIDQQIANYSGWLNGSAPDNFTLVSILLFNVYNSPNPSY
jgi:transmembrane E3 ubiquitin-protein ligase